MLRQLIMQFQAFNVLLLLGRTMTLYTLLPCILRFIVLARQRRNTSKVHRILLIAIVKDDLTVRIVAIGILLGLLAPILVEFA